MITDYRPELLNTAIKCVEACCYNTIVEAHTKMLLAFRKIGIYISHNAGPTDNELKLDPLRIEQLCKAYPPATRFSHQEFHHMATFARFYSKMVLHKFAEACRQSTTPGDLWMKDPNCRERWQRQRRDFQSLFLESIVSQLPWRHHEVLLQQAFTYENELFCAMLSFIKDRTPLELFKQQLQGHAFRNARRYVFENGTGGKCHSYMANPSMSSEILQFVTQETDDLGVKDKYLDKLWKTILSSSTEMGFNGTDYSLGNNKFVDIAFYNIENRTHLLIDVEREGCTPGNHPQAFNDFQMYDSLKSDLNKPVYYVIGLNDPAWQAELALKGVNYFDRVLSEIILKERQAKATAMA